MDMVERAKSSGLLRYLGILHDLVMACAAFFLAYVTAIGWTAALASDVVLTKTLAFVAVAAVVFFVFSVHRGSWRYVSIPEFLSIIKVSVTAVVVYTFGSFVLSRGINVPRSVPVLAGMYLIAGLAGPRLAYRLFLEGSILPVSGTRIQAVPCATSCCSA